MERSSLEVRAQDAYREPGLVDSANVAGRPIRVVVVDDHELVRTGLNVLLSRAADIQVVGAFDSGEGAIETLGSLRPDVVLLDYRLPGMSGSATCAEIVRRHPGTSVIILTTYVDDEIIHACLVAGARGYILKDASLNDLIHAIHSVTQGDSILAPQVTDKVVGWARTSKTVLEDHQALTPVESTVLALVAEGLTNPSIAERLNISPQSVKLTLRAVMGKLRVAKRSEAVAVGIRRGLI